MRKLVKYIEEDHAPQLFRNNLYEVLAEHNGKYCIVNDDDDLDVWEDYLFAKFNPNDELPPAVRDLYNDTISLTRKRLLIKAYNLIDQPRLTILFDFKEVVEILEQMKRTIALPQLSLFGHSTEQVATHVYVDRCVEVLRQLLLSKIGLSKEQVKKTTT